MNKLEERKYDQIRKLGQELHIPIPEHFIELEVVLDGKVIQKHKQRSHSWVRNAYNLLLSEMASKNMDAGVGDYGAGFLSIKTTGAAIQRGVAGAVVGGAAGSFESNNNGYRVAAAVITSGILVGSGVNAESFEDYVLQTPITEGVGAGQLNHVAMEVPTGNYNGGTLTWTITWQRFFNNNSGGNVSVEEVTLCCKGFCVMITTYITSRDKLGATVTIPDTGQLKVTYTIQLTYPA